MLKRTINGKECVLHHCASRRGYCRKEFLGTYEEYKGRFGQGFIERDGCYYGSTQYEAITYWIEVDNNNNS